MRFWQRLVLYSIIGIMMFHSTVVVIYIALGSFIHPSLRIVSIIFATVSYATNPIIIIYFAKKFTRYSTLRFLFRVPLFFPVALFTFNSYAAINPILMQKLLKLLGIFEVAPVHYSVIWLFYGKILTTGVLDAFCQSLIIGNNIEFENDNSIPAKLFVWSVIIIALALFTISMCCCLDIIVHYVEEYSFLRPLRQSLLKPKVYACCQEDEGVTCSICLDDLRVNEEVAMLPKCRHTFHQDCLSRWLEHREICPLCRSANDIEEEVQQQAFKMDTEKDTQRADSYSFITEVPKLSESPSNRIQELYGQLSAQIKNLNQHIDQVLLQHESDFLSAYKCQMFALYKQLKELKQRESENSFKIKQSEEMQRLEKTLDWFRNEAVRLGDSVMFFRKELDKWKAKASSLEEDCDFFQGKIKELKKENYRLQQQLGNANFQNDDKYSSSRRSPMPYNIDFEPTSINGKTISELLKVYSPLGTVFYEIEKLMNTQETKFQKTIMHYKNLVNNDKRRIKSLHKQNTSVYMEKTDLEDIFVDSVKEVRKDIEKSARAITTLRPGRRQIISKQQTYLRPNHKKKIMENFLCNDKVVQFLYEHMFPHRANILPDKESILTQEDIPDIDELMSRVPSRVQTSTLKMRQPNSSSSIEVQRDFRRRNITISR